MDRIKVRRPDNADSGGRLRRNEDNNLAQASRHKQGNLPQHNLRQHNLKSDNRRLVSHRSGKFNRVKVRDGGMLPEIQLARVATLRAS